MKRLKTLGIIIMALLVAGVAAWQFTPAVAKEAGRVAPALASAGDEGPGMGWPGRGFMMGRMANPFINGNIKSISTDSIVVSNSNLRGKDITFQVNGDTQYRYARNTAPATGNVSVGNFITIMANRVPNLGRGVPMLIRFPRLTRLPT